jgi:hypothetical protein
MRPLLVLILIVSFLKASAQIADVPAAFSALSPDPQVLHLKKSHIKVPSGGHLQGIQALSDSQIIITASSGSYAYYLTANRSELTSIQKLTDSPLRHAGGCQIFASMLFVGVEDNISKDSSQVYVASHFYPNGYPTSYPIIHRTGSHKRSTAGALGITDALRGYLLAVADWDSRNIDFYLCQNGNPLNFDSLTTYHAPAGRWPSYQSVNLLTGIGGKIYMIGFALEGLNDIADLYELTFSPDGVQVRLVSTRTFKCKGTSFRYGSGIYISPDHKLSIYSIARNVKARTSVSIFK